MAKTQYAPNRNHRLAGALAFLLPLTEVAHARPLDNGYRTTCFDTCESSPRTSLEDDPFQWALDRIKESRRGKCSFVRERHYGAMRTSQGKRHAGTDLFVPATPIQAPADRVVLIGVTRERSRAGRSIGNGIALFVPDSRLPYFLLLAHLSERTFEQRDGRDLGLNEKDIGREIVRIDGLDRRIAYTGSSRSGSCPHLHITAATIFYWDEHRVYTAKRFMNMYERRDLGDFLRDRDRNFNAIVTPARTKNPMSLEGYLNPEDLIRTGRLSIRDKPEGQRLSFNPIYEKDIRKH